MTSLELGGLRVHLTGGSDGQGGGNGPCVILMHGYGAPGVDLVPIGRALPVPSSVRFAFPEGPIALEPYNPHGGRAFWQIDIARIQLKAMLGQYDALSRETPEGLGKAFEAFESMFAALKHKLQLQDEQFIVGGFSQGSMLATEVFLRGKAHFAGLGILSGTLINSQLWLPELPKHVGASVFMSHGRIDPVLPFALAQNFKTLLDGAGLNTVWVPFEGGHGIPAVVLERFAQFIRTTLEV